MTQETKIVALEKFLGYPTLKPLDFWAGEALEARRRDCLNIMYIDPKMTFQNF